MQRDACAERTLEASHGSRPHGRAAGVGAFGTVIARVLADHAQRLAVFAACHEPSPARQCPARQRATRRRLIGCARLAKRRDEGAPRCPGTARRQQRLLEVRQAGTARRPAPPRAVVMQQPAGELGALEQHPLDELAACRCRRWRRPRVRLGAAEQQPPRLAPLSREQHVVALARSAATARCAAGHRARAPAPSAGARRALAAAWLGCGADRLDLAGLGAARTRPRRSCPRRSRAAGHPQVATQRAQDRARHRQLEADSWGRPCASDRELLRHPARRGRRSRQRVRPRPTPGMSYGDRDDRVIGVQATRKRCTSCS